MEPNDDAWNTPKKIGHLFMNRFSVDEDASSEMLNVLELGKTTEKISNHLDWDYARYENERKEKGMGLDNLVCIEEDEVKLHFRF